MKTMRKLGMKGVSDIPWGTHFCNFFLTTEDLIETLVPYFKAGLENNEFCMWITSGPLDEKEAGLAIHRSMPDFYTYLNKGQIEILPHTKWYLQNGVFDKQRVLNLWLDKLEQALNKGYDGMRVTGSTDWLERKDWESWVEYERQINKVIGKYPILAVCNYGLLQHDSFQITDGILNHHFIVIRKEDKFRVVANSKDAVIVKNLEHRIGALERVNKIYAGRELKMIALKEEIKRLKEKLENQK